MSIRRLLCTACIAAVSAGSAFAAPTGSLERRAWIGAAVTTVAGGATVGEITAPQADRFAGLEQGDVILEVDGKKVGPAGDALAAIGARNPGDNGRLVVRRGGNETTLSGRYASQPVEIYANGVAHYGVTPFEGGQLRDILVTPPGGAMGPVVFYIQGYTCDTVEAPQDGYRQHLIDGLLARGVSTYRIEKPGVGDSRGGAACADIDFATETRAFQAGYQALRETHGVPADRIFILGHSLGGLEAPLLAAAGPAPRGVAVYGTVVRNWRDYMLDALKYQGFMAAGADPADGEIAGERFRSLMEKIYGQGQSLTAIAAANPADVDLLRALQWDGGERLMGRQAAFWRQISETRLLTAWRDTRSEVLAVVGESDFAAVDAEDHKLIVDVANHYRPGSARFVSAPRTGHGMTLDGNRAEARTPRAPGSRAPFNDELIPLFADWIEASMAKPAAAATAVTQARN